MSLHDLRLAAASASREFRARRKAALQNTSILGNRLTIEQLEPRVLLAADAPVVAGNIDTPGETDSFTVKIADAGKYYFDSLTDSNNLNWKLTGPGGSLVSPRAFGGSDSRDINGANVLDLQVGEYTLTVDGVGDTTGAYAFRLLDLADATVLELDEVIEGNNPGKETDLYKFDVTAGESFFFDAHLLSSGDTTWRLVGPDGEFVSGPNNFTDSGEFTLGRTGSYTLAIEGRDSNNQAFDYAFTLAKVVDLTAPLTIGQSVLGRVPGPGGTYSYTFTLATDRQLVFDALIAEPGARWSLSGPRGKVVDARSLGASDGSAGSPLLDLVAGSYRLDLFGDGDFTGNYAFRLLDPAAGTVLTPGETFGGTVGNTSVDNGFERDAGAPLDYAALPGTTNRAWHVGGYGDLTVADQAALKPAQLTLEAWLLADQDQHYEGAVTKISSTGWGDGYALVRVGNNIRFFVNYWAGTFVEAPLPENVWTHVAGTYDGSMLRLYINGELAGEQAFTGTINHSGAPLSIGAAPGGDYLWGGSIDEVRLWNVARTGEQIAAALGAPVVGTPSGLVGYWRFDEADGASVADVSATAAVATRRADRATETQIYRFTAAKGDHFFIDRLAASGAALTARVLRPDGKLLAGPVGLADIELADLPMDGTYTLLIEGHPGNLAGAAYSLQLLKVVDSEAALTIGAPTSGHIAPGSQDLYRFTLATDRKLLFDALTNTGSLSWTLTGPRGTEVASRGFNNSDAWDFGGDPVLSLPPGAYELRIDGAGDAALDYVFRLSDIAAGIPVTLGAEVAGRLDPANESDVYRFTGAAGDEIAITKLVGNGGGDAYLRVLDPTGRQILSQVGFSNTTNLTLAMAGTYTVLVEARYYVAAPHDYSIRISQTGNTPPPNLSQGDPLTLGANVTGTLDGTTPDLFTFTTTGPKRVYFDSQTWDGGKTWTLVGPRGTEVGPVNIAYSDSWERGGNLAIDLPLAGTYQLRLAGTAGTYAFRLLDLAAATPVTLDNTLVSGTLSPANVTHAFRFDGIAGETIALDVRTGADASIRLVDSFGRQVYGHDYFDDREIVLPATGAYTLLVEGRAYNGGNDDYGFTLSRRNDAPPAVLTPNVQVDGTLARPGNQQRYTFTVTTPGAFAFDSLTDNSGLSWTLTGPVDTISGGFRTSDSYERSVLPTMWLAGSYELTVDGTGATYGDFSFRLVDLAADAVGLAADGTETAAVLDPAKETHVYSFTASAGERFVFDDRQSPPNASFRLVDPFGRDVTSAIGFSDRSFVTELAGTYYLLIEGRVWDTAATRPYRFALYRPATPAPVPLAIGTTYSAAIARPTEQQRFEFTLTEPRSIYVDSNTPDGNLNWTLATPWETIAADSFYYTDAQEDGGERVIKLAPGTYSFTVSGSGFTTGTASFRLLDLAAATPLTLRQTVSSDLAPATETDMYRFTAVAGQRYYFRALQSVANAGTRFIDPDGRQITGARNFDDYEFVAEKSGTYTVFVEGRTWDGAASRPYSFAVYDTAPSVQAMQLDGVVGGPSLTTGKAGNALRMTAHEEVRLDDPALDLRQDLTVEFWVNPERTTDSWVPLVYKANDTGPNGSNARGYSVWLNANGFIHLSSFRGGSNDALETAVGTIPFGQWSHVAAVISRSTGEMKIFVNGVQAASRAVSTALHNGSPDTPVYIGSTTEFDESYRRFEGAIDEVRIWNGARTEAQIQAEMNAGSPSSAAGLVARLGFDNLSSDRRTLEAVSGSQIQVRSDFTALDGVVQGRLTLPGEQRNYTFSVASRTLLAFDSLHDNDRLSVTVTGPDDFSYGRNLRNGDSYEAGNGNQAFYVEPGQYTVTVDGNGANTGNFAFRLIDLGAAETLAKDTVIDRRITGSGDTHAYKLAVAPGERLFIDVKSLSSGADRTTIRLIDPFGRQIIGPTNMGDIDTGVLAAGGTYTLLIEGRVWREWPTDYRMAVYSVGATVPVAITLDGPNPDAPKVEPGKSGNALTLRGVDYVEVPNGAAISPARNLTYEGWYRLDRHTDTWTILADKGNNQLGPVPFVLAVNSSGAVSAAVGDAAGNESLQTANGVFRTGEWMHVALVSDRDGQTAKIYVNGAEQATRTIRGNNAVQTTEPLGIGHNTETADHVGMIEGAIDSIRLWTVARSAADIAAGMVAPALPGTAGLSYALDFESTALSGGALLRSLNPNGVSGALTAPGQTRSYTFTLGAPVLALFDSLTDNEGMVWTLTGPNGDVVTNRRIDLSDSRDIGNPTLRLDPGAYTLTIDGAGDTTGFYNFRLTDLATAAVLPMATVVTGELTPSNATAAYKFAGNAGEKFIFDALAVQNEVWWRLVDPAGNDVVGSSGFSDLDGIELPSTGTYTLLVEGRVSQNSRATYSFQIAPQTLQTAPLTLGARVDASVGQVGESDAYTFTLANPSKLYFDTFNDLPQVNFTLRGPNGVVVANRALSVADGIDISANPVFDLPPGAYTLTLDGAGQFTGSYAFRLLDLAAATEMVPGGNYNGTFSQQGRETDVYRFTATQGMRFAFDSTQGVSGNNRWRLIDPLGQQVYGQTTVEDTGLLTAALAGTYTLLLEGRNSNTADAPYAFTFDVPVQPAGNGQTEQDWDGGGIPYVLINRRGPAAQVIAPGPTGAFLRLTDSLANNVRNDVAFSATGSGRQDSIAVDFDFRIARRAGQTTDPEGITLALLPVSQYGQGGPGPAFDTAPDAAGVLALHIDPNDGGSSDPDANHVQLHYNGAKLADFSVAGLTLASGDWNHARMLVERTDGGVLVSVLLTAPGGATITAVDKYFVGNLELETHRAMLSAYQGSAIGEQELDNVAVTMTPAAAPTPSLTLGAVVNGSVARAGGVYRYSFTVTEPTPVMFDAQTNNGNLFWQINGPTQTGGARRFTQTDSAEYDPNPVMLLDPGTYEVLISASGANTGSYAFRLVPLSEAGAYTLGTSQSVTLTPGSRTAVYKFDATAGQKLYFDNVSGSTEPYGRLIDPSGNVVFGPNRFINDLEAPVLPLTGTYYLTVEGRIGSGAPQTLEFAIHAMQEPTQALTLGATTAGAIAKPGDRPRYTFSLATDARLVFDSLTDNNSIGWTLTGPTGTIDSRSFQRADSTWRNDATTIFAKAGDYVLTVDAGGDITGDYAFRLFDMAAATPLTLNTVTSGQLNPATGTQMYRFTGATGERLFFDAQSNTGNGEWRLLDPQGKLVFTGNFDSDRFPVTLALDGTYTLLFEGRIDGGSGTLDYQFQVTKVVDKVAALTLGETYAGTLDLPRQDARLTFTLDAETLIFVDPISNDGELVWTLTGPFGDINARNFRSSDAHDFSGNPVYRLPAGDYTLVVNNQTIAGRNFAVRVLDLADGRAITPGIPVSGTLSPGSETEVFRFDAAAGEEFFFDRQSLAGTSATWRLIGPNGRQLFWQNFDDFDGFVAPIAGTYTLLLEGRIYDEGGVGTYGFNVFENPDSEPVIIDPAASAPDLVAAELAVSATGTIHSGSTVTFSWKTRNTGTEPATGAWSDRVIVRNLDTNEVIGNLLIDDTGGTLAPGAERVRQTSFTLPAGNDGVGRIGFSLALDVTNAVTEQNPGGTAEANNAASVEITSALAPFADLVVTDIVAQPASGWKPGDVVTFTWTTTNEGNQDIAGGFSERIQIRNASGNQNLVVATVAAEEPLAAGASRTGTYQFTWPAGLAAHGSFEFTVTTDILDEVAEANAGATGETNNASVATAVSAPDLTLANLAIAQSAPSAGDTITLTWNESNLGNADTLAGWTDRVHVQNLDTGEVLLDTTVASLTALSAGVTRQKTFAFALPEGDRSVGRMRVTVFTDRAAGGGGATVREVATGYNAEGNNTASVEAEVTESLYPDLAAVIVTAPAAAMGGGTITVSWEVSNTGGVAADVAGGWVDRVVLSSDAVVGNGDDLVLANVARSMVLAAGGKYTASSQVVLPGDIGGQYRLFVVADAGQALVEPDTRADNTSTGSAITITSKAPNLVADAVFGPSGTVSGGETFTVSWRVRNAGDAVAPGGHVDRIVLSADDTASADDLVLAEVMRSTAVAIDGTYSVSVPVSVQDGRSGQYRLILVTDSGQTVFENLLESDNTRASAPITFASAAAANLVVESVTVPDGAVPGQTVAVTYVIRNTGTLPASAPWSDRIYIDDDTTVSGATTLATVVRSFDLAPGASYEVTREVTLPTNLGDDGYHVMVRADVNGQVFEGGIENDNDRASLELVLAHPDLVPDEVAHDGGATVLSNSELEVRWKVRNGGTGPTLGGWTDTVWLSLDDTVGTGDIKLGDLVAPGPLAAGEVYEGVLSVTLPIGAQGAYKLIVRSDSGGEVVETSAGEANNTATSDLQVGLAPYADLEVSDVTAPALTVEDPARVTVGWTVTNLGTGAGFTSSWVDRIVVSADGVYGNGDDVVLGEIAHAGALGVGESYQASANLILPAGFYGRYTLFVRTDASDQVFENGADANRGFLAGNFDVSPTLWADLYLEDVVASASALSGGQITVEWEVGNQGPGLTNTADWVDTVYLEKTDGTGRVTLGQLNHLGFLAPNDTYRRTATFALPEGISGQYRVVVAVPGSSNPRSSPYEFVFTGNNTGTSDAITVTLAPSPDLRVTSITAPTNGEEGSVIDVEWTVANQGLADATGSWVDRVYLRKAGETGAGTLIGTYSYTGPLQAGTNYSRREEMRLPDKTSDAFEIVVVTDAADAVYEHNAEANNRLVDDRTILVAVKPRPDLQVSSITVPDRVSAGATASVEFTVVNQGLVAANGTWTDQVWLSLDDKITSDDILVSSHLNASALDSLKEYNTESNTFTIPKRFRGTVYVLVRTDSGGAIDEWPNDTLQSNVTAQELYVDPIPFADMVVDNVVTAAQAFEGDTVSVRYTVTNRGAGDTDRGQWAEQIWLTRDKNRPHPGQGDVLLSTLQYNGGVLEVGKGYDRELTLTLPTGLASGTYYIMPWVDPYGTLLEDSLATNVNPQDPNEINGSNYRAREIAIVGTPPQSTARNIAVRDVIAPPTGAIGEPFTVSWTVEASGDVTSDKWSDTVILADAPLLENATRTFNLGSFANLKALDPGQSYTNSATFDFNPAAAGLYVIVRSSMGGDTNPLDNQAFAATSVTNTPADLQVTSVVPKAPGTPAYSGELTSVTYTVENKGARVWEGTQYWKDEVWISKDPTFIRSRASHVATVIQPNGPLGTGESYTRTAEFALPPGVEGEYYVYVFTNTDAPVPLVSEGSNNGLRDGTFARAAYELPQGNSGQAQFPVEYREPDLQVTELTLPDTMAAGSTIEVTFKVQNVGNRATRENAWVDRLYLSLDSSLDEGDWLMSREASPGVIVKAEAAHSGVLAPGEFYYATVTVTLPFELEGQFHVIAMADSGLGESGYAAGTLSPRLKGVRGNAAGAVREFQGEGNNTTSEAVTLTAYTPPDLQVTALEVPERVVRGQKFTVEYTVTNSGGATPALQTRWDDLVYISRDPYLDLTSDRFLGSIRHDGALVAGGSYDISAEFTLPTNLGTEAYYVFVITDPARYDSTGALFEANERNNARGTEDPLIVDLPPPTDIQVTDIVVPDNLEAGDPVRISWTVENTSGVTASGSWTDAVYLSADATWDIGDKLLGRGDFSGTLTQGQSYTLTLDSTLPGAAAGNYRVIVRTDVRNQLHEDIGEANNTTASPDAISIAVDELTLGIPLSVDLLPGQERLYRIEVPADQTLRFRVGADNDTSINEVFLRHDAVPTSALFDATYTGPLSQELTAIVPDTEPGVYYVLVRGYSGPAEGSTVTLTADLLPLVITDIDTDTGGDSRFVTATIKGAQFNESAVLKLSRPGIAEFEPVAWKVVDSATIIATFDFTGAPHGLYDLKVINPDGSETVEPYRFLIERGIEPEVTIGVGGPRVILAGDQATYSVALQNLSNLDAPYTYFQVGVPEMNYNQYVFGLPFLDFYTNVRGTPEGAAGGPNVSVPWINLESITNVGGQLLTSGFLYDHPANGFAGFSFNVATYPGLKEMADRAFDSFRTQMARAFPQHDELLAEGEGNLEEWWEAVKETVDEQLPGAKNTLDKLDFVGLYNQNTAVPSKDEIPFIPYRFHVVASATTMTRAEFVAFQSQQARDLRAAVLAAADAPGSLLAIAADEQ
ncbi:MAG TPA: CARDB domain-containing protein, partial [Croceibacterium sp.]